MILGCDIGTAVTKAVLLTRGDCEYLMKIPTDADPDKAMKTVLSELWRKKGVKEGDLKDIVVTGWGQEKVSLPHKSQGTLNCLGKAAVWRVPSCRTVLFLGAQESMVLSVNEKGRVMEYVTNDKCASGGGRFLETIFKALEVNVDESADIAKGADRYITMSSQCAVFAESEVVSLVNEGESVANIVEAIFQVLAKNMATLSKKINTKEHFVVAGGLANNRRIVGILQEIIQKQLHVFHPEPDFIAAVGAALSITEVA